MKYTNLIFCSVIILLLMGCDPFAKEKVNFYGNTKSTVLLGENVNSISLNSKAEDVQNKFAKPNEMEEVKEPKSKYIRYDGIEFGLMEDKVFRYYFNKNYQTTKGIQIGDHKEKVIKEYGKNYYTRVEGGLDTIGYFDKENKINIEFGIYEDKVTLVIVEKIGKTEI